MRGLGGWASRRPPFWWGGSLALVLASIGAWARPVVDAPLSPPVAACVADKEGYCTTQVVQYAITGPNAELRLNTGLGSVVFVEFPPGTRFSGSPAIGNTAFFGVEGHNGADGDRRIWLLIRPKLPSAARGRSPREFYGQTSNIQIFLVGAPTLNLKVRLVPAEQGVFQAFITLPEREEAVTAARRKLEREQERAQLDAQVSVLAFERMLESMAARFECRDLSGQSIRDFLIFRTHSICRIGQDIYIGFSIKNRRRGAIFRFDKLRAVEAGQEPTVGTLNVTVRFQRPEPALSFGDEVRGHVGFRLPEGARQFGPWNLTLVEDGGANREVQIEEVGF